MITRPKFPATNSASCPARSHPHRRPCLHQSSSRRLSRAILPCAPIQSILVPLPHLVRLSAPLPLPPFFAPFPFCLPDLYAAHRTLCRPCPVSPFLFRLHLRAQPLPSSFVLLPFSHTRNHDFRCRWQWLFRLQRPRQHRAPLRSTLHRAGLSNPQECRVLAAPTHHQSASSLSMHNDLAELISTSYFSHFRLFV